jgi:hypothetical protein
MQQMKNKESKKLLLKLKRLKVKNKMLQLKLKKTQMLPPLRNFRKRKLNKRHKKVKSKLQS